MDCAVNAEFRRPLRHRSSGDVEIGWRWPRRRCWRVPSSFASPPLAPRNSPVSPISLAAAPTPTLIGYWETSCQSRTAHRTELIMNSVAEPADIPSPTHSFGSCQPSSLIGGDRFIGRMKRESWLVIARLLFTIFDWLWTNCLYTLYHPIICKTWLPNVNPNL